MSYLELKLYICAVILLAFPSTPEGALDYDDWLSTFDGKLEWTPDLVALNNTLPAIVPVGPSSAMIDIPLEQHALWVFLANVLVDVAQSGVAIYGPLVVVSTSCCFSSPRLTACNTSCSY